MYLISTVHELENHFKVKNYSVDFSFWSILLSASTNAFLQSEIDIWFYVFVVQCFCDVSCIRMFYGPGGPYALFAGKDASRALAKMSFEEKDLTGDISGLGPFELEALQDWEYKFMGKYVKVGTIKKTGSTGEPSESTSRDVDASSTPHENHHTTEASTPHENHDVVEASKPHENTPETAPVKSDENTPSSVDADKEE